MTQYPISDEFQSKLEMYKATDLVDVLVTVIPDESSINYASERVKELIEIDKGIPGDENDSIDSVVDSNLPRKDRKQIIREMKQYYEEAMQPLIGYLEELGKVSGKDYNVMTTLGTLSVHITKSQIYEVAEVDNVSAILENQKIHALKEPK